MKDRERERERKRKRERESERERERERERKRESKRAREKESTFVCMPIHSYLMYEPNTCELNVASFLPSTLGSSSVMPSGGRGVIS